MTKVLIATEKPFSKETVSNISSCIEKAGFTSVLLESYTSKAQLIQAVSDVSAIIVRSDVIDKEVIEAAQNLKIIVRAGAGYDNIDSAAASNKGIVVMNTPGQNANAVAELVFGLMIYHIRTAFSGKTGSELKGKNIGIHAFGSIGKIVAKIAQGFGMNVYAFDPYVSHDIIEAEGVVSLGTAQELYTNCQFISLHIPATEKTKESINYSLLSKMPKNAVLINTARKEVVHENDLQRVLEERSDFSYLSDIAPGNQNILKEKYADRVLFTAKKSGAQTAEANSNAGIAAAKQIIAFITKGVTTYQINK